ncbi:MAG TPA: SIS domain-containing protein, partial [Gemmatimonadaceae bacterium]
CSDVRHVSVEFVHPVIVGKRALPAIGLTGRSCDLEAQIATLGAPDDMAIAFGARADESSEQLSRAIAVARARGCLTMAFDELGAEVEFRPACADAFVWQELVETLYHVLWELVHVFFEHGSDRSASRASDVGASAFLYPFLATNAYDRAAVTRDVARSVRTKADEVRALRERTLLTDSGIALVAAANALRERLDTGGTVLAFGNGGSATDAMDLVADLRTPPHATQLTPRRALDLTEDSAILTALANDVGPDVQFARQIIAYGTDCDVAVGFSTSGSSRNICTAFAEARRRGIATIAFTGYDGGRIAAEGLADHVIIVPSQYVPRIQEAHATAYHIALTLTSR